MDHINLLWGIGCLLLKVIGIPIDLLLSRDIDAPVILLQIHLDICINDFHRLGGLVDLLLLKINTRACLVHPASRGLYKILFDYISLNSALFSLWLSYWNRLRQLCRHLLTLLWHLLTILFLASHEKTKPNESNDKD